MRRTRRSIWVSIIILALVVFAVLAYTRANNAWQESYRKQVSEGIVNLLQTNPFDRTAVVVIVIDGLRWEEGIGAQDRYTPHIWSDLRPQGTLLTNYRIASPTATTSSHTAMITGRISTVPNDGHIRPVFPTLHEYYRDARSHHVETELEEIVKPPGGVFRPDAKSLEEVGSLASEARYFPPEKTALYLGKDLIYSLDQSSCGRYPEDDVFLIDRMRDVEVTEFFRAKIPDVKPNMIVINLADVDEAGHEAEWHHYVDTIRWADRLVWEMWEALQAEMKYRERTIFVITTDHGRHIPSRGGYPHHGCFCEGCQHSFMLLVGPGIREGYVSDKPHSELDLVPTIGRALGFATPAAKGEAMMEVFEDAESLPNPRETPTTALVERDRERVDDRDTAGLLLETLCEQVDPDAWGGNPETALLILAMATRAKTHPSEAGQWADRVFEIAPWLTRLEDLEDLVPAYPLTGFGPLSRVGGQGSQLFTRAVSTGLLNPSEPQEFPDTASVEQRATIAALAAAAGRINHDPDAARFAYSILLDALTDLEGEEKVYAPGLEDFIDNYHYRGPPNEIFTEREISMRERMWLLWGIERVLAESDSSYAPDLHALLERQYRLLVAFVHEWQDANAMVGGNGELGEGIDFVAQGLCLSALAEFEPWRKWELDELGYSPNIYATPLFSWPEEHFFYIMGQVNALAGAWAAYERLQLFVNDDGSIRHDLLDSGEPLRPTNPDYPLIAAAIACGLSRFKLADYDQYDLEIYPLVHQ